MMPPLICGLGVEGPVQPTTARNRWYGWMA